MFLFQDIMSVGYNVSAERHLMDVNQIRNFQESLEPLLTF